MFRLRLKTTATLFNRLLNNFKVKKPIFSLIEKNKILKRINDLFIDFKIIVFINMAFNFFTLTILVFLLFASKVVDFENFLFEIGLTLSLLSNSLAV